MHIVRICSFVLAFAGLAAAASAQVAEPTIHIVAGSGVAATTNGAANVAAFLEPDGVAAGPGGVIYIADGRANTIREIADGKTRDVAGSITGNAGFADGPATRALFDRPVGIAAGRDGTLYVADSKNRRIRTIKNGVVGTLAGSGAIGSADGPGNAASFTMPKGIAVDAADNVYVADYGVGIREIRPDREVTTLSVPNNKYVYAVAARGAGNALELAYTDGDGIHIVDGGSHRGLPYGREREPYSEENTIGHAFGIAIVDASSVVVTDLWTDSVRYVNFDDPPFRPAPKMRVLAGGKHENRLGENFATGVGLASRADLREPYGVAYTGDGHILVADSGNRVVREIDGLDPRLPIASKSRGVVFAPKTYRIAIVGDSYAWNDVLWPESFAGVLESALVAHGVTAGLSRPARVEVLSASAGTFASGRDFISTYLADGEADLVIFEYDRIALTHELQNDPSLDNNVWKSVLPGRIASLARDLEKQGTLFALALVPLPQSVSPNEGALSRELNASTDSRADFLTELDFENTMAKAGIHTIQLLGPIRDAERHSGAPAFYNALDNHLTVNGSVLVGNVLSKDVLTWKPWSSAKR